MYEFGQILVTAFVLHDVAKPPPLAFFLHTSKYLQTIKYFEVIILNVKVASRRHHELHCT